MTLAYLCELLRRFVFFFWKRLRDQSLDHHQLSEDPDIVVIMEPYLLISKLIYDFVQISFLERKDFIANLCKTYSNRRKYENAMALWIYS